MPSEYKTINPISTRTRRNRPEITEKCLSQRAISSFKSAISKSLKRKLVATISMAGRAHYDDTLEKSVAEESFSNPLASAVVTVSSGNCSSGSSSIGSASDDMSVYIGDSNGDGCCFGDSDHEGVPVAGLTLHGPVQFEDYYFFTGLFFEHSDNLNEAPHSHVFIDDLDEYSDKNLITLFNELPRAHLDLIFPQENFTPLCPLSDSETLIGSPITDEVECLSSGATLVCLPAILNDNQFECPVIHPLQE